jgi:hypothetical protein
MTKPKLHKAKILAFLNSPFHGESSINVCNCAYNYPFLRKKLAHDDFLKPRHYLDREDMAFQDCLDLYKETAVSATFSPHNTDHNTPYFVPNETLLDLDQYLRLRTDNSWRYQHVVYIGPKGSGKTSMQNHWLSINRQNLERNNILYLRCDAQRLFDSWSLIKSSDTNIETDRMPSIEDYFDFQLLAVLAWEMHKNGLAERILNQLKAEEITFPYKEARAEESDQRIPKPTHWYITEHVHNTINRDPQKDYLVENLFLDKKSRRREFFRWQECASSVKQYLKDKNTKLLLILDGVDNLHLNTKAGIDMYSILIPQLSKFVLRRGPSNELRVAVMRERTWIDVQLKDANTVGCDTSVEPEIIHHKPPETSKVAESRIQWMVQMNMSGDCVDTLKATLRSLPPGEILHYNMRTLIVNSATLAEQIRFRWHQLGKDTDMAKQAMQLMKRNLFLNGCFYLETQKTFTSRNREKGLPYINPFWIDDQFIQSKSQPSNLLLRIRMLEMLYKASLPHSLLEGFLVSGFGYSLDVVTQVIQDARAFGWIDSRRDETQDSNIIYDISATGVYLLTDLLNDIDILYMLALDTPLPTSFFEQGLVAVHANHVHQRSGYIGAALVTVLSFLLWLYAIKRRDSSLINHEILEDSYDPLFLESRSMSIIADSLCNKFDEAHEDDLRLFEYAYKSIIDYANENSD